MTTYECPTCGKTVAVLKKEEAPFRPFCCQRCKWVDLGKWLDGTYALHEPMAPKSAIGPNPDDSDDTPIA